MSQEEIFFFLNYGYFPVYQATHIPKKVDKIDLSTKSYNELLTGLHQIFQQVIQDEIEKIPENKKIIIPISGGLDSRAILAEVLNLVPKTRIKTYTFGIPGSYDYEIGKEIALKSGVTHQSVDLNQVRYSQEEMLEIARRCDYQTHLFHHPPLIFLKEYIEDNIIFSGYLGDLIFGSYSNKKHIKIHEAPQWYLKHKKFSFYLKSEEKYNFEKYLYQASPSSHVSPAEQLILYERGPKLTAPHILMKDWKYSLPLIDKRIMDYMFSLPQNYRKDEKLFIDSMLKFHPKLFNIRAKTTFGYHLKSPKWLLYKERIQNKIIKKLNQYEFNLVYPPYNYLDFNKGIIERKDFKEIFQQNIQDLEKRDILGNLSPVKIYEQHFKTKNLYQILILLVSLEIILKAKEQ